VSTQQCRRSGLVRQAKLDGLKVSCDISINSLHLTDADIGYLTVRPAQPALAPAA